MTTTLPIERWLTNDTRLATSTARAMWPPTTRSRSPSMGGMEGDDTGPSAVAQEMADLREQLRKAEGTSDILLAAGADASKQIDRLAASLRKLGERGVRSAAWDLYQITGEKVGWMDQPDVPDRALAEGGEMSDKRMILEDGREVYWFCGGVEMDELIEEDARTAGLGNRTVLIESGTGQRFRVVLEDIDRSPPIFIALDSDIPQGTTIAVFPGRLRGENEAVLLAWEEARRLAAEGESDGK